MKLNLLSIAFVLLILQSCSPNQDAMTQKDEEIASLKRIIENSQNPMLNGKSLTEDFAAYAKKADTIDYSSLSLNASRIPARTAKARIMLYKALQYSKNPNYEVKKDVYGFVFSLKALTEYVEELNSFNQSNDPSEKDIDGVRLYYGRIVDRNNGFKKDVFFVPTVGNRNYYDIDDDYVNKELEVSEEIIMDSQMGGEAANSEMLLDFSTPCPFDCN